MFSPLTKDVSDYLQDALYDVDNTVLSILEKLKYNQGQIQLDNDLILKVYTSKNKYSEVVAGLKKNSISKHLNIWLKAVKKATVIAFFFLNMYTIDACTLLYEYINEEYLSINCLFIFCIGFL